jgi:serine/threonine-protein kinase
VQNNVVKETPKEVDKDVKKTPRKSKKTVEDEKKVRDAKNARVRTLAETTGAPAVVSLKILPWGWVELDGRMQGESPPLKELQVVEGKHEIKIRNTTFPVVTKIITVKSGEKIKISHTFAN